MTTFLSKKYRKFKERKGEVKERKEKKEEENIRLFYIKIIQEPDIRRPDIRQNYYPVQP